MPYVSVGMIGSTTDWHAKMPSVTQPTFWFEESWFEALTVTILIELFSSRLYFSGPLSLLLFNCFKIVQLSSRLPRRGFGK